MKLQAGRWYDIPGYGGSYQANIEGEIRRIFPDGRTRVLKPCRHEGDRKNHGMVVNLYCLDGRRRLRSVGRLIAETFLGPTPPGMCVCHKNGMLTDNAVANLVHVEKQKLWSDIGSRSKKSPVIKINASGEIIGVYPTARKAAAANYISYSSLLWRCNGGPKTGPAGDGCDYAWEDDKRSIKAAKKRLAYVPRYKRKA